MNLLTLFPAHAGVILVDSLTVATSTTFPRMRGGDPMQRSDLTVYEHFSPHTRG